MAWALLLLTLLTYCSGSSSQPLLTQTPSVSMSPGENVRLTCTLSSGYSIGSYRVEWYQQKLGSAPRFVYHYYTSSDHGRGTGIPERFTVSPDTSNNLWNLVISGVQAEDDADYYCAIWDGRSITRVFGGGTQLTVLGQPKASPTVHLFPPSAEEMQTKSKATLVCLLNSFYPGSVQVTWQADGQSISTGVETTKPSKQSDNKFMASSYLSLNAADWKKRETYTCQVTHDGKNFEKSLKSSECS